MRRFGKLKRIFSLALAAMVLLAYPAWAAQDPAEGRGTVGLTGAHSATYGASETGRGADGCTCAATCTGRGEGQYDETCVFCSFVASLNGANPADYCSAGCICEEAGTPCPVTGEANADCPVCRVTPERCRCACICGEAETPCGLTAQANGNCPVCSVDPALCSFVCVCEFLGNGNGWDCIASSSPAAGCRVCTKNAGWCRWHCVCPDESTPCTGEEDKNPDCPRCRRYPGKCDLACICGLLGDHDCKRDGLLAGPFPCAACAAKIDVCAGHCSCPETGLPCVVSNMARPKTACRYCSAKDDPYACRLVCTCPEARHNCAEQGPREDCPVCRVSPDYCSWRCICPKPLFAVGGSWVPAHDCWDENQGEFLFCRLCFEGGRENCAYPWTADHLQSALDAGGSVVLRSDTKLGKTVTVRGEAELRSVNGAAFTLSRGVETREGGQPLVVVEAGGRLTVEDVVLDGNSRALSADSPLVRVESGGSLVLGSGAALVNNDNPAGRGGGVLLAGGSLTLTGDSSVAGNHAASGGGVLCEAGGKVFLSGSPRVVDNSGPQGRSNLCLEGAGRVEIASALDAGARIGVRLPGGTGLFAVRSGGVIAPEEARAFSSDAGLFVAAAGGGLELVGTPSAAVAGRVTKGGLPVQNAAVTVVDTADGSVLATARTDGAGVYRFNALYPGQPCRLLATALLGGRRCAALADSAAADLPDLALEPGMIATGELTGGDTRGMRVRVLDEGGEAAGAGFACGGGRYDVFLPAAGGYRLEAEGNGLSASGWIELAADGSAAGGRIAACAGGLASGIVLGADGQPAADVTVTLEKLARGRGVSTPPSTAMTDRGGRYAVSGIEEGARYALTAFSPDGARWITQRPVAVSGGRIAAEDGRPLALSSLPARMVKGKAVYFKSAIQVTNNGYEFPREVNLEFLLPNGLLVASAPVGERGEFTVGGLADGVYRLAMVRRGNADARVESEIPVVEVRAGELKAPDGFPANGGGQMLSYIPEDGSILVGSPRANEAIAGVLNLFEAQEDNSLDFSRYPVPVPPDGDWTADREVVERLCGVYRIYSAMNELERDMMPTELEDALNSRLEALASKYKVVVGVRNRSRMRDVGTNLVVRGEDGGQEASPAARRIAALAFPEAQENEEIALTLTFDPPSDSGVHAIREALASGEALAYFDMTLRAALVSSGARGEAPALPGGQELAEPGQMIEVRVEPPEGTALDPSAEYRVARAHGEGDLSVDLIEPRLEDGGFVFETDKFSTYAIIYARPETGIVIESSSAPEAQRPARPFEEEDGWEEDGCGADVSSGALSTAPGRYGDQYGFWLDVHNRIRRAPDGSTVTVDAKTYDMLPSIVMQALSGRDVTLVIRRDGGEDLVLRGLEVTAARNTAYYPFDMLDTLAAGSAADAAAAPLDPGGALAQRSKTGPGEAARTAGGGESPADAAEGAPGPRGGERRGKAPSGILDIPREAKIDRERGVLAAAALGYGVSGGTVLSIVLAAAALAGVPLALYLLRKR